MVAVVLVVAVIDALAGVAGDIEAVALLVPDICPRRSPIAATAAVTAVTVTPVAVTVRVTVTAATVNGVTA
jgi:hypothetical protein